MKWMIVVALSLLLVMVCVVYLRHGTRPYPGSHVEVIKSPVVKASTPPKAKARPPKPGPKSPIDISGPLKDRELISWVLPEYPEWAQEQGVTGIFKMKIWVTPEGKVKSFMEPQQLSAAPRLDENAMEAVRQWKFAEKPNAFGDQWGIITVRFTLLAEEISAPEASLQGISLGGATVSGTWHCVKQWFGKEYRYYCRLVKPETAH